VPKLSICVPTYNRAGFLIELLESLVQGTSAAERARVEVCVSDNASTDGTEPRVREFASRQGLQLVYHRNPENLGADRNFLKAVTIATGEYCWLMGSDDMLPPGLIGEVLARLDQGRKLLLMGRVVCNVEMQPHHDQDWLRGSQQEAWFDLADRRVLLEYLARGDSLGALCSFLSSIVVARDAWNAVEFDDSYIGSSYSHVYVLLQVALRSGVLYAPSLRVLNRSGNDSFLDLGAVNRVLIDLRGFIRLADDLLRHDPEVQAAFLRVLERERPVPRTSVFLAIHATPAQWAEAGPLLQRLGAGRGWLAFLRGIAPVIGPVYDRFMALYRRLRYGRPA
jgi:abequosyltransferase